MPNTGEMSYDRCRFPNQTRTIQLVSTRSWSWVLPSVCGGAALYLYVNLFVFRSVPILLSGDQLYFWMDGGRILHGELPYRDFFQFTPPGTDLFYFGVFKLFGPHIWVTNLVVVVLGTALCGVCFSAARKIMAEQLALPATILFLTLIYTKLLNATHHWFSVLAILCAIRILLGGQSRSRMLAAGGYLGLACFFTQSHAGASLSALLLWLVWRRFRESQSWSAFSAEAAFAILGFAGILGTLESYFIVTIGWKQLWYFQVTYVLHFMVHSPETSFLGMPPWDGWRHSLGTAQCMIVYLLLPIVYAIALWRCWKWNSKSALPQTDAERSKRVMLIVLTGAVLLCEVMFSLNWLRIYAVSMPGIILLLWLIGQQRDYRRVCLRAIWAAILLLAATQVFHAQRRPYVIAALPAGRAAINPESYQKLHWVEEHTHPEEWFFQAVWPGVYLPLQLHNPVFLDGVGLNIDTRPEFLQRSIGQLEEKKVRYILWSHLLNPAGDTDPPESALPPLRVYLHQHYKKVKVFADQDEIWERD